MPDIFSILDDLGRNVTALRESLGPLQTLLGKDGPFPMAVRRNQKNGRRRKTRRPLRGKSAPTAKFRIPPPRPRRKFSPKGRAALKLGGRYMGLVRNLTAAQKAKGKKVREGKGVEEAIKMAAALRAR